MEELQIKINPKEIMREIKENSKKLDSCSKHDFSMDATPADKKWNKKYRCVYCGGEVGLTEKHWYEKELEHGTRVCKEIL